PDLYSFRNGATGEIAYIDTAGGWFGGSTVSAGNGLFLAGGGNHLTLKGANAGAGPDVIFDTTNAITGNVYAWRNAGVSSPSLMLLSASGTLPLDGNPL